MIQIKYTSLFEIEFLHDYYTNKLCRDIAIIPSLECSAMLSKLGLRFIATDTGCKVFARTNKSGATEILRSPLPENTRLVFLLVLKNKLFQSFTQFGDTGKDNPNFYFNNLVENISADGSLNLVKDKITRKTGSGDMKKIKLNTYQFNHSSAVASRKGEIVFTDSGEKLIQHLDNNAGKFNFSFDLKKASPGRADFFVEGNNNSVDTFYSADASDRQDIFGILEIFHQPTLSNSYKFIVNNNVVSFKKYKIHFANRQSIWRYNVLKKFNTDITSIEIKKANGTTIEFVPEAASTNERLILSSKNPLPFTEDVITGIKMTDQNNKEIIAHLPNASLQALKEEGGKIFSDIYVTI